MSSTRAAYHPHVLHVTFQYYCDMDLHETAGHIPYKPWSTRWMAPSVGFDEPLLAQECVMNGVIAQPSSILHPSARVGCFTSDVFGDWQHVGYYNFTILHETMNDRPPELSFRESALLVSPKDFNKKGIYLRQKADYLDGRAHDDWSFR